MRTAVSKSRALKVACVCWGVFAGLILWAVTIKAAAPGQLISDANAIQLLLILSILGGASGFYLTRYERQITAVWSGAPMALLIGASAAELFATGRTVPKAAGIVLLLFCSQVIFKTARVALHRKT